MLGPVHMSVGRDSKEYGTINQITVIYWKFFYYVYEKLRRFTLLQLESNLFKAASRYDKNNIFHLNTSFSDEKNPV